MSIAHRLGPKPRSGDGGLGGWELTGDEEVSRELEEGDGGSRERGYVPLTVRGLLVDWDSEGMNSGDFEQGVT